MDVRRLLTEVCVGFCLPPEEGNRLEASPPASVDEFTDAIWIAEEMDPPSTAPRLQRLRDQLRERVARAFADGA